jgi:SPP1 gp7 family putative phage head morphogenesis protein
VDIAALKAIVTQIADRLRRATRAMQEATAGAYAEGAAQASVNLSRLSDDYTRPITSVLSSEPYLRRSALVGARVFEEMEGFAGKSAADLARILMTGIEQGRNPRIVAREIRDQFGITKRRAETIARTEITGALRRGRLDEEKDAQDRLGIKTGMLWQSALSPTTRDDHAKRHGNIYTTDEIEAFYSRDGNGINCKSSFSAVLLDDDGRPISDKLVERMAARREAYLKEVE